MSHKYQVTSTELTFSFQTLNLNFLLIGYFILKLMGLGDITHAQAADFPMQMSVFITECLHFYIGVLQLCHLILHVLIFAGHWIESMQTGATQGLNLAKLKRAETIVSFFFETEDPTKDV